MTGQSAKLLLVSAAAIALGAVSSAPANAKPFYEGKTIKIVVGSAPGAGNDIRTRLFARHAPAHIPGHPKIIVQNMGGGGGLRARNYMYNIAKPDGLTIAEIIRGTAMQEAIGEKAAHYHAAEFEWIGNMTTGAAITEGRTDRVGHNLKEAVAISKKRQLRVAATDIADTSAAAAKMLRKFVGLNMRLVLGYHGGAPMDLAMERGEVDMRGSITWSSAKTRKKHWFKRLGGKPFATILSQIAPKRLPELSDVPTLMELAPDPQWRAVAGMLTSTYHNAFPLLAPPKTPKALVNILRKAFWATMHDPKYLADARKIGYTDDEPLKGEEVQHIIESIVSQPKDVKDRLSKMLLEAK